MNKITKETIEQLIQSGWKDNISDDMKAAYKNMNMDWIEMYTSPDKRFILRKTRISNMCDKNGFGWDLHVDNSDMCTIATCAVEYIEQIYKIMEIYKNY